MTNPTMRSYYVAIFFTRIAAPPHPPLRPRPPPTL